MSDAVLVEKTDLTKLIGGIQLPSGEVSPGRRSSRTLRRRNAVVACSFDLAGKRVLDVGCADGLHSLYMAQVAEEVWGVDHRASEIAKGRATAEALGIKNVRLETGDIRDPDLFRGYGKFDLAVAWGFLHRVGDIFALLYNLETLANAVSLEWRTPVVPMMSTLSIAYHPPGGDALDPMNVKRTEIDGAHDKKKIEGDTAFWEPTPGAVREIMRRLGYAHATLLGYGEKFDDEGGTIERTWGKHLDKLHTGKARLDRLPRTRVHMLFEKEPGSIALKKLSTGEDRLPKWDQALLKSLQ